MPPSKKVTILGPPTKLGRVFSVLVVGLTAMAFTEDNGSWVIAKLLPPLEPFIRTHLKSLLVVTYIAHVLEYRFLMVPLLNAGRVTGLLRFKYFLATMLEGGPSYFRIKRLVN